MTTNPHFGLALFCSSGDLAHAYNERQRVAPYMT